MEIEPFLHKLLEVDHQVASMPKSSERFILQEAIGKILEQLLIIQEVESAKGLSIDSIFS